MRLIEISRTSTSTTIKKVGQINDAEWEVVGKLNRSLSEVINCEEGE